MTNLKSNSILLSFLISLLGNPVWALNVQTHQASSNTYHSSIETGASELSGSAPYSVGAEYSYVHQPLVELNSDLSQRKSVLVHYINTLNFTAGSYLYEGGSVFLAVPIHLIRLDAQDAKGSLGDLRIAFQHELTPRFSRVSISLIPELVLPTGNNDLFLSNGNLGFGGKIAATSGLGPFTLSGHLGYMSYRNAAYQNINYSDLVPWGVGAFLPLTRSLGVQSELSGSLAFPLSQGQLPNELLGGARIKMSESTTLTASAGLGAFNTIGSIQSRYVLGLHYRPAVQERPVQSRVIVRQDRIDVHGEIPFEHNSAKLTFAGKRVLDDVADAILAQRGSFRRIIVEGHTNFLGTDQYNLSLSISRANSVRAYLVNMHGLYESEITAIGFGEDKPKKVAGLAKYDPERLDIDRRVEFRVIR